MENEGNSLEETANKSSEAECGVIMEDSLLKNLGYNFLPLVYAVAKSAVGLYAVENIENPWVKGITIAYSFGSSLLELNRFRVISITKDKRIVRSGLIPIEAIVALNLRNYKRTT
jgi:hypothetical protein